MRRVRRIYGKEIAFSRPKLIMSEVKPRQKRKHNFYFAFVLSSIVLGAILGLAIFLVVSTALFKPPVINITRQQYNEALAKWRAAGIEEYQMVADTKAFLGGTLTVRYNNSTGTLLSKGTNGRPFATPEPEYADYARKDTIEGMFEDIDEILQGSTVLHTAAMMSSGEWYMAYRVEFDPELGYPKRVSGRPITSGDAAVYDADFEITITEFQILKKH